MTSELVLSGFVGILAAIIGAIIIVNGWSVTHNREMERSLVQKRRDLRVQFLIEAYRRLEYVSNRKETPETASEMERTIADIQLFGSASQVEMAQSFAMEFSKTGTASLDSLISELRQSLRAELNLKLYRLNFFTCVLVNRHEFPVMNIRFINLNRNQWCH